MASLIADIIGRNYGLTDAEISTVEDGFKIGQALLAKVKEAEPLFNEITALVKSLEPTIGILQAASKGIVQI